ncbi:MAG: cytochrome C oxidase subunit IV family protein [Myxococcales bacterium]|nr:cytochrome C oxidase subunit IV family protein [Myxococcales bacterium]
MSAKDEDKKDEKPADEAEERDESGAEEAERDSSGGDDDSGDDDSGDDDSGDDDSGDDAPDEDEEAEAEAKPEPKKAAASEPPPSAPKAKARSVPPPAKHEHAPGHHAEHHGDMFYVQIWAILVVLLVVSVVGPMLGHPILTLITAFGIALVKAYMVAKNFMHLAIERRYVVYMLVTMVAFMVLLFAGVAPDVMKHKGHNWKNEAAEQEVKRALEAVKHDPHKAH